MESHPAWSKVLRAWPPLKGPKSLKGGAILHAESFLKRDQVTPWAGLKEYCSMPCLETKWTSSPPSSLASPPLTSTPLCFENYCGFEKFISFCVYSSFFLFLFTLLVTLGDLQLALVWQLLGTHAIAYGLSADLCTLTWSDDYWAHKYIACRACSCVPLDKHPSHGLRTVANSIGQTCT